MKKYILLWLIGLLSISTVFAYSFGQNKVNATQTDWAYLQTMHFDIYYPAQQADFGRLAALMAEERYYYIKSILKYPITSRIPVIFYASKNEFQTTNIIYPILSEGVGGFTESLKNRVVIPFEGSYAKLEELLTHELTHAYLNALDNRLVEAFRSLRPTSFPFWFSEGLPEYLSIGGEDAYNNMFVLDMVLNDNMPSLEYLYGYLAYRLGESLLSYIGREYGSDKVSQYFYAVRSIGDLDEATKQSFGMNFEELESRWKYQLKRDYYPTINSYGVPHEIYEQRTQSSEDGSYFNLAPRFSPDGNQYVYFSSQGARYSIWLSGTHGLSPARKIITGEASGKMEEFYYFRSNLSWFPDSRRIAFVAKTADGDRIHIADTQSGKILQSLRMSQLSAIYEIDVSPDGASIAMAAQSGMQTDIFVYDLQQGKLDRLTDDDFDDGQPRYNPDGSRLAFRSERYTSNSLPTDSFFGGLSMDIFSVPASGGEILQHTFEDANCSQPFWNGEGDLLYFVSDAGGISNLQALDLITNQIAKPRGVLSGVYSADYSEAAKSMILSIYFDDAWDIYSGPALEDELEFADYPSPAIRQNTESLISRVPLANLDLYGRRERVVIPRTPARRLHDPRRPFFGEIPYLPEDSLQVVEDYAWDRKPTEPTEQLPQARDYKPKFHLDSFWGGFAYAPGVGAYGNLELGLSDLMGNHGIGINLGIAGKIEDSNILLSYLYLKQRADYGIGVYNLFDRAYYRSLTNNPEHDYFRSRQRETGLYFLIRYPFNKFWRVDLEQRLYQWEYHQDSWQWNADYTEGSWIQDEYPLGNPWEPIGDLVYSPGLSVTHDNAIYGSTGPLVGWRGMFSIRKSFAPEGMDFLTNYLDLRSYSFFSKRYAWANRFIGGVSTGGNPQRFDLGGYYGVRAYSGDLSGEKKLMYSTELRFPFFDRISMAFPLPLDLGGLRGAAFMDLGAVWDEDKDLRGMREGKLEDIHLGYGFGPRLNLGYFVLKFDVTWLTDLSKVSKPSYYLSLTEDF